MAYDGWVEFNDVEIINVSRTAQLARALGIPTVRIVPARVKWIQDTLGGVDYHKIENAPWYDPGYPASAEFAGIIPLSLSGLGDSTLTSTTTEYTGHGGNAGRARNETLPIVGSVLIIASTERGAEFGKRWFDRQMSLAGTTFCSGSDLRYFRYAAAGAPKVHYRNTKITRGTTISRRRKTHCSATWTVNFTLTAADPFEYGEPMSQFIDMGQPGGAAGAGVQQTGVLGQAQVQSTCPVYDYTPIFDPENPALSPSPMAPDFLPAGWNIKAGDLFQRHWVRLKPVEPTDLAVVPMFRLFTANEARRVRLAVWDSGVLNTAQCDPLWSAVVNYLPAGDTFYLDGEQQAAYVWDGGSEMVRRADSLVFSQDAKPVDWRAFNDHVGLLVTMDLFYKPGPQIEGNGTVRVGLDFVSKSD